MKEIKDLWIDCLETYDASWNENFRKSSFIMDYNDFQAYIVLFGLRTKDFLASLCYIDSTYYERLECSHEQVYMGHHSNHCFRHDRQSFHETIKMRDASRLLTEN